METIKLSDVIITGAFKQSHPSEYKMNKSRVLFEKLGKQPKPIVLNDLNNVLIDGYVQYLIAKEMGLDEIEFIRDSERPTYMNRSATYVYGTHVNGKNMKEYVWRVPHKLVKLAENIKPGDIVIGATKYGKSLINVTKVDVLDKCPRNKKVKCVVKNSLCRDGLLIEF